MCQTMTVGALSLGRMGGSAMNGTPPALPLRALVSSALGSLTVSSTPRQAVAEVQYAALEGSGARELERKLRFVRWEEPSEAAADHKWVDEQVEFVEQALA